MTERQYRYQRSDFQPLSVSLDHLDITLSFFEDRVEGGNALHMRALKPLESLALDARDLEIHAVDWRKPGHRTPGIEPLPWEYRRDEAKCVVRFPRCIETGETFTVCTKTTCRPSDSVLEGIYKDTTPPGCPQQYMSQCQQWGFQRILPILDDCRAKCSMRTTLEADARYTHLISNGDVDRAANPEGKPILQPHDPSRQVITYRNEVPMAPYLFIAAVGTWDVLEDEVTYPGGRRVRLEYLVPPGRAQGAVVPMQILKDSVLWQGETQEYEYPFEVYRTICMEKSNFGGMENVGNTTIVTSAALIDEFTSDTRLQYAYAVIVHEFEHNQCGSEVTMETPFDMWLNEGFTVDVERQYLASRLDPDVARLEEVDSMRAPTGGPLAVEDGGHLGNIVREHFNHPDELVDGVTYVKAAEVIRMLRLILGEASFRTAKNRYFERYSGKNADTAKFFRCFEEISGRDLAQFRREWLHSIGYPRVEAEWRYDDGSRTLTVTLCQTRSGKGELFHVPLALSAVDAAGRDIPGTACTAELTDRNRVLAFENVPEPEFVSFNRDCSFYGTFSDRSATPETLARQIRLDPCLFNRVEAMRKLTDFERLKLIGDPRAVVAERWLAVWDSVLRDESLPPGLRAHLLRIDEQSLDRSTLPLYRERYAARIALLETVASGTMDRLRDAFDAVDTYRAAKEPKDGIQERALKAVLLRTLIAADTPDVQRLAEAHFRKAWSFSDKGSALRCINISSHPDRLALMREVRALWKTHLNGYTTYLAITASGTHEDVFDMIAQEEQQPEFRIEHPSHSRMLYLPMASNNKMLWTDRGIDWLTRTAIKLAPINENAALHLVDAFRQVHHLTEDLKPKVLQALETMDKQIPSAGAPSVAGRIRSYLKSPPSGA